jgi:hypothetical protein
MAAVAAMGSQKKPGLLVLEWAAKASPEQPPLALLIELGRKDVKPAPWSGRAVVTGAKVVHREGYCFQDKDKLVAPDAWEVSSHRPIRVPRNNAALAATEGVFPVGIVLHLADVQPDATVAITAGNDRPQAIVAVKDVLAGQPKLLWDGTAAVRRISIASPVETGKTEDDFPAACYGPDGTLWVAYISYTVKEESRRIEPPSLKEQPKDFKAYYTPEFGDQLFVKYYRNGKWSEPIAVTEPKEDLVRCAIAAEANGNVWIIYSAHRNGAYDLYARRVSLKSSKEGVGQPPPETGPEQRVVHGRGRCLQPVACTDQNGNVRVTYQYWEQYGFRFSTVNCVKAEWTGQFGLAFGHGATTWSPATASGLKGEVIVAYDSYDQGDYDILTYNFDSLTASSGNHPLITSSRFEARPSLAFDPKGRLWIAYEEGPEQWGKNFGVFDDRGNPLYFARTVRVVCLEDGKLMRPVAELPPLAPHLACPDTGQKAERVPRYAYPQIGIDGNGRVWLTYRQKFGTRYSTHPGSYWISFARRLEGDHWSEPIELHHSDGLLDSRPVLLPHSAGGLRVIHNTDNRFTTPEVINNDIWMSYVDLPGDPVEPKLVAHEPGKKDAKLLQEAKDEQAAVKRIREIHRRLPRTRAVHADVHLRAQRQLPARPP